MSSPDYEIARYERNYQRMGQYNEYHLRHLASHLYEAGEHEKLYQLLAGTKAWLDVKFSKFRGDAAYLDDINIALHAYQDPLLPHQYLPLLGLNTLRYVLRQRVQAINDDGIQVLVWLNRIDEAYTLIYLRSSVKEQLKGLITLCVSCCHCNKPFQKYLNECLKQFIYLPTFQEKIEIVLPLVQMLALCQAPQTEEYFDKAVDLIDHHADKLRRAGELYQLVEVLCETGYVAKAQQAAALITDEEEDGGIRTRSRAFQRISITLAQQEHVQDALTICRTQISSTIHRRDTLLEIAQGIASSNLVLALALFNEARQLNSSLPASVLLKGLALISAYSGKTVRAMKLALNIFEPTHRASVLIALLPCIDPSQHPLLLENLYSTIHLISHKRQQVQLLSQAIFHTAQYTEQPYQELLETLLQAVSQLQHRFEGKLLRETLHLIAQTDDFEAAEILVKTIQDNYIRFTLTSVLAVYLAKKGHPLAEKLLQVARQLRLENYYPTETATTAINLSLILHKQGITKVNELIDNLLPLKLDKRGHIEALLNAAVKIAPLAPEQADLYLSQCEKLLNEDNEFSKRASQIWIDHIRVLAMTSHYDQAQQCARSLAIDHMQAHALSLVADIMAKQRHPHATILFQQLKEMIPNLHDPLEKALMLCLLAQLLNEYEDAAAEDFLDMAADATYSLNELWERGTAETDLVGTLISFGYEEYAREVQANLPIIEMRSSAFLSFINFEIKQGNFERALQVASTIPEDQHRNEAFRLISLALIKAGLFCRGIGTIDLPTLDQFLLEISESLLARSDLATQNLTSTFLEIVRIAGWINLYWKQIHNKHHLAYSHITELNRQSKLQMD